MIFKRTIWISLMILIFLGMGCKARSPEPTNPEPSLDKVKEPKVTKTFSEPKTSAVNPDQSYQAVIKTEKGDIRVELFAKEAPIGVTNFIQLARGGFYDGLTFHRVEKGFVIQGGDPSGNGTGGPGYTIPAEIGPKHLKGALAWARTGDAVNPQRRSSGSQFYITLAPTPFLDGAYSVFGQTLEGMEVVGQIAPGDKILGIDILEK